MELSVLDFERFKKLTYEHCGIVISQGKEYLVRQRLEPIVNSEGLNSFGELHDRLERGTSQRLREEIICALTTNETSFFRDGHPYQTFKDFILPQLGELVIARKQRPHARRGAKVHIWSAASSTGQEAYSIAMLIHEYAEANAHRGILKDDFTILSTDVSTEVLAKAITGEYSELEVSRGLPAKYQQKYFQRNRNMWILSDCIRAMVEFRQLNLNANLLNLQGFDSIFCRNVLIYFDDDAKRRILDQFHALLTDNGYLILGASENVYTLSEKFESTHRGETLLFQKCSAVRP